MSRVTNRVSLRVQEILALVVFGMIVYLSLATPRPIAEFDLMREFARTMMVISGGGFLSLYAGLRLSNSVIGRFLGLASLGVILIPSLMIVVLRSPSVLYLAVTILVGIFGGLILSWDRMEKLMSPRIENIRSPTGDFSFGSVGLFFFGGRISILEPLSIILSGKIQAASLKISRFEYAGSMVFWSLFGGIFAALVPWIAILVGIQLPMPLATLGLGFGVGLSVFSGFYLYPLYRSGAIKKKIDGNLAYTTNYLRILIASGATVEQVFESLGNAIDAYGVRESTRRIIRSIQLLGDDVFEAMDSETRMNPSNRFGELLQGFVSTARSGGDIANYFTTVSKKQIDETRHDIRKVIDNLALAGEIYISALVALPIVLVSILTISGLFGGEIFAGFSAALLLQLIVYFMIPILAVSVLLMIDALAPRSDS